MIAVNACRSRLDRDMDPEPTEQTIRMVAKTPLRLYRFPRKTSPRPFSTFAASASFITGQILAVDGGLGL